MILLTLATFVIGILILTFYVSRVLREKMQRVLSAQQFSTASFVADVVNDELDDRFNTLKAIAKQISPTVLGNTAALQALIEQRPVLPLLFNSGTWVSRQDGIAIASLLPKLIGTNYSDREYLITVLKEGKSAISKPITGKVMKDPIIVMAVPIRDAQGKVIGALAGVTDLSKPNFLNKLSGSRYGKTGGYIIVAPQYRQIITASVKSRVMEILPTPGIIPTMDRFIQGYEGSVVFVNRFGIESLTSTKRIPTADWFVAVDLPTAEAFAPIHDLQRRILIITIILTFLVGGLIWFVISRMLQRKLSPIFVASRALSTMADSDQPQQLLPVTSQDEIGELIGCFNLLLKTLGQREQELQNKNTELESFAYTVSHDLKSPLITIQAYAGMILKNIETGKLERAQDDIKRIEGAAGRMTSLLNGLLELSRVGRVMGEPSRIDMNRLVSDVLAQLTGVIKQSLVEVVVQPNLPAVLGDNKRIAQVVQNLVENAIKCRGDQTAPRIEIGVRLEGKESIFYVKDNGKGIAPRFHESIFELFKKLETDSEGSGVGLALVKRIIEVHGGRVWVESEGEGMGSTFCFTVGS